MLSSQLNAIALGRADESRVRGKVSLLYTPQQAAEIDVHTLYAAALQGENAHRPHSQPPLPLTNERAGFAELCQADSRFEVFSKSLFSKAGAELNRELQVR